MKLTILLLALSLAVLSSCTTAYKSGQTPDDVYYSPTRPQEEYVQSEKEERTETRETRYEDEYYEDRYLRMKVRNRARWSDLDDWYYSDYRHRSKVYLGSSFCTSSWNPYSHWNNYYNPYYQNYAIINVKSPLYNKPRNFNLNAYNANTQTTKNYSNVKTTRSTNNTYNGPRTQSTNTNSNPGNILRDVFRKDDNSSSNNNSNSSSSGNNSSGGTKQPSAPASEPAKAPVRRF